MYFYQKDMSVNNSDLNQEYLDLLSYQSCQCYDDNCLYTDCFDPDQNVLNSLTDSSKCQSFNETQFKSFCDSLPEDVNIFSTFHLNIRSLPKNCDLLTHYLSTLKHNFTVVALTETWLTKNIESLYNLTNYTAVHRTRESRPGGGVSLFAHNDFDFIVREDLNLKTDGEFITESIFIEIMQPKNGKTIITGCVYRPPDADIDSFNDSIINTLDQISKEGKMCYILGDYNIDLFKAQTHTATLDFLNGLYSTFFPPSYIYPQE